MDPLLELESEDLGGLRIFEGERVALLGPSGAGKTQVLRALIGLVAGTHVRLRGRRAAVSDVRALIGWVPEGDGVFLDHTVLTNVAAPPHAERLSEDVARDALDLVALAARAGEPVARLSRAERRRVALARAIASRRPVLVVDGDLDPTLAPLLPLVLEQAPHLKAVLTAGCQADDWAWAADSVALVADGRVVAQGPLAELACRQDPDVKGVLTWVMA